ncbi:Glutathione S-transferase dhar1, mitochondrial [Cymbomonas tetramitiformis]|uniref:Glutathione S-transferase dhar1, mitochondrial n=1 Tax=Cymbomonas tetramitiformis TaxID=36881 RepID=A0AAE0BKD6_9CHLO|nr:Glutathione S-transferase dhar1, mitochondrial [Cymbomonas tetramitiformis]
MAICSLFTVALTLFSNQTSQAQSEEKRAADLKKQERENIMQKRRDYFQTYSEPLLDSANELQQRLFKLASADNGGKPYLASSGEDPKEGAMYTAYCFCRFLGFWQILARESPSMDFGKPIEDRLLNNLLSKLCTILSSSSYELRKQHLKPYTTFMSDETDTPRRGAGDAFVIHKYSLQNIGDLMRRRRWDGYVGEFGKPSSHGSASGDAVLSFADFKLMLQGRGFSKGVRQVFAPLIVAVNNLPACRDSILQAEAGEFQSGWARLALFQSALIDLICLLDSWNKRVLAAHRVRLYIGNINNAPMPAVIQSVYNSSFDLSSERASSSKLVRGCHIGSRPSTQLFTRFQGYRLCEEAGLGKDVVTVFVKRPASGGRNTDCPFSQKVLISLEENRIPYVTSDIDLHRKPWWYLQLNPAGKVPAVYHKGILIDDSQTAVSYFDGCAREREQMNEAWFGPKKNHEVALQFSRLLKAPAAERSHCKQNLIACLLSLEDELRSTGPFFGGKKVSSIDIRLFTQILQVKIAGPPLASLQMPTECVSIEEWMSRMCSRQSVKATMPEAQDIIDGWGPLKQQQTI